MLGACAGSSPWKKEQAEVFINKGISYIELRQYPFALKEFREAQKYSPRDHRIYYYKGMVYHGMDMKQEAMESFKEAISLKADYSEAHNYLGTLYMADKLWDKAIEHFDKAVANPLYPTPAVALYNAGLAYYSKKDYTKALESNRRALQREPQTVLRPQIEKNIGLVFFEQSDFLNAIYHLQQSVELNPNLFDAYFYLGEAYFKIGNKAKARKAFESVVELAPKSDLGKKASLYLQALK